jgi:DNA polymerase-3 subunit epsilon
VSATIDIPGALVTLQASKDYRVLRRFAPRTAYALEAWNLGAPPVTRLGLYVDVEATGLDTEADEIIELGAVPFTYDPNTGVVFDVRASLSFLEEPRRAISPAITELTGITQEMVAGKSIDEAAVTAVASGAAIVIAHNANYDRRMLERRLPIFAELPWACSQREIPWKKFGVHGGALQNILMSACGEFTDDAHRGVMDCYVGVHVLAAAHLHDPLALEDRTALSYLLESARQPTKRVCAIGSPMHAKDLLRGRGYRALYQYGRFAYWYIDLRENVDEELEWCRTQAFAEPEVQNLTAKDRYSIRADQ